MQRERQKKQELLDHPSCLTPVSVLPSASGPERCGILMGAFTPAAACQCDLLCVHVGDCCGDAAAVCYWEWMEESLLDAESSPRAQSPLQAAKLPALQRPARVWFNALVGQLADEEEEEYSVVLVVNAATLDLYFVVAAFPNSNSPYSTAEEVRRLISRVLPGASDLRTTLLGTGTLLISRAARSLVVSPRDPPSEASQQAVVAGFPAMPPVDATLLLKIMKYSTSTTSYTFALSAARSDDGAVAALAQRNADREAARLAAAAAAAVTVAVAAASNGDVPA